MAMLFKPALNMKDKSLKNFYNQAVVEDKMIKVFSL